MSKIEATRMGDPPIVNDLFVWFQEAKQRRDDGHVLKSWHCSKCLRLGFTDLTEGIQFPMRLFELKEQLFGGLSLALALGVTPGKAFHENESKPWGSLGLTTPRIKEILRTSESRATWFGAPLSPETDGEVAHLHPSHRIRN